MRLRRGASAQAVRVIEGRPGATPLTIGSAADCDWQIRAASVPAHALYVLVDERGVCVHAGPDGQVRINGRRLGRAWQRVDSGARFDMGLACVEIELSPRRLALASVAEPTPSAKQAPAARSEPDASGVRPSCLPRPIVLPSKVSHALRERSSRPSFSGVATLFGKPRRRRSRAWRYVLAAFATAAAYVGWVLLLDG